jgi:hypothetical protein
MIQGGLEDMFKEQQRNRTDTTMRREVTPIKERFGPQRRVSPIKTSLKENSTSFNLFTLSLALLRCSITSAPLYNVEVDANEHLACAYSERYRSPACFAKILVARL